MFADIIKRVGGTWLRDTTARAAGPGNYLTGAAAVRVPLLIFRRSSRSRNLVRP